MKLNGRQKKAFHQALQSAFPRRGALEQFVSYDLDENLEAVAGSGPLDDVIYNLIKWAESEGRTEDLLEAAQEAKPDNEKLAEFIKMLEKDNAQIEPPPQGAAPKPEEPSTPSQTFVISGDYIAGDKTEGDDISVGNITDSKAVAIGRSSSASVVESNTVQPQSTSSGGETPGVSDLYDQLVEKFNLEELKSLCFDLGVDFENLGGTGKSAKARELVLYMQRRGNLDRLHQAIQQRPD